MSRHDVYALGRACALCAAIVLAAPATHAQNRPFPQNVAYPFGFRTTRITADNARTQYELWKSRYLKTDCGNGYYRVEFGSPTGTTVSEGMGYGMVLTAYYGDKAEFDGLWKFVQKNTNANGVMGWKVDCNGYVQSEGGQSSATDGDLDIAFALRVAIDQWGDAYRQPFTTFLAAVKSHDFTTASNGRVIATSGDWGGNGNTSYWMPGYYRVFQEYAGDGFWTKAASDAYALLLASRNATTGFVGNSVDANGANLENQVDYNGCRIPWRVATDYVWYGTAEAKNFDDKLTDWASSRGIQNLVDGYLVDGTAQGQWHESNPWTGGWAAGAMTKDQSHVDNFATWFNGCAPDDNYYSTSLRALYMLTLTGNFWRPGSPLDAGTGGAGGTSSTGTGGGSVGGSSNGGPAGAGGAAANSDPASVGCSCVFSGDSGNSALWWTAAALLGAARLRRRKAQP
jgi:MYXO-CTERM domain-containing protein